MGKPEAIAALKELLHHQQAGVTKLESLLAALEVEAPASPAPAAGSHVEAPEPKAGEPAVLPQPKLKGRMLIARRDSACSICGEIVSSGSRVIWDSTSRRGAHYPKCGVEG